MAIRGPVGSLGNPDDDREYIQIQNSEIMIFVEKTILDELPPGESRIDVSFGGFGKKPIWINIIEG